MAENINRPDYMAEIVVLPLYVRQELNARARRRAHRGIAVMAVLATLMVMYVVVVECYARVGSPSHIATVSADDLWSDFESNEITATREWTDEEVWIKGKVKEVSSDGEVAYVVMQTGTPTGFVTCLFTSWTYDDMAQFKKGKKAKIKGTVWGLDSGTLVVAWCSVD